MNGTAFPTMLIPRLRGTILPTYRMYRLEGDGRIAGADWLEAADDRAAILQARDKTADARFELWEGPRLVHRVLPDGAPATVPTSPREA